MIAALAARSNVTRFARSPVLTIVVFGLEKVSSGVNVVVVFGGGGGGFLVPFVDFDVDAVCCERAPLVLIVMKPTSAKLTATILYLSKVLEVGL